MSPSVPCSVPCSVPTAFPFGPLLQITDAAELSEALDRYLETRSYLSGFAPTCIDHKTIKLLRTPPPPRLKHALRWYRHITARAVSYSQLIRCCSC
uniref:Uncharacterized protein n=1 Tax=Periophthalmus magnuspinnatus TaxID=409849 RepID=A0A3B4AJF7_9GOBI